MKQRKRSARLAGFSMILGLGFVNSVHAQVTGSCCTNVFVDAHCYDGVTQEECFALPTTTTRFFHPGATCLADGCLQCELSSHCGDAVSGTAITDNRCTLNQCIDFFCEYSPTFDSQTECCNPANGNSVPLADNSPCTTDTCNPTTGQVLHTSNDGMPCSDYDPCTLLDVCTGTLCRGTPVSQISCSSDTDCSPQFCNQITGKCVCTDLCPDDPAKSVPGVCGCNIPDVGDADADGTLDCVDVCPGLEDYIFAPDCVPPIPTMSGWGLIVVALLLLIGGKLGFPRPREIIAR